MLSRIPLITGLIASLALVGEQQAQAADGGDVAAGVAVGAIIGGVLASQRPGRTYEPAPVYQAPPPQVVYYQPRPVYYRPRPVYHQPPPVYYTPGPVYYVPAPPPRHKPWRHHLRHRHHDYRW